MISTRMYNIFHSPMKLEESFLKNIMHSIIGETEVSLPAVNLSCIDSFPWHQYPCGRTSMSCLPNVVPYGASTPLHRRLK